MFVRLSAFREELMEQLLHESFDVAVVALDGVEGFEAAVGARHLTDSGFNPCHKKH